MFNGGIYMTAYSKNINVLITSVGNIGVGNNILNALKLSDMPLNIIGIDISEFNIPVDRLNSFYKIPRVQEPSYKKEITDIIIKNHVDIIFVGCEQEYHFFQSYRKFYEKLGAYVVINSDELGEIGFDKYKTYEYLKNKNINVPKYCKLNNIEDCKNINFFPVVIKPNKGSASSQNVFIAFDIDDAKAFSRYLLNLNVEVIAQEYVGNSESEYTIQVTSDSSGNVLGCIITKRNFDSGISYKNKLIYNGQSYIISSGITQGEILHNDFIKSQAINISLALNSRGPLNIQGMFVNDVFWIIEVHPMITGSVYIRALAGYNEPENIIKKEILNENVHYNYTDAKIVRELISRIKY